MRPSINVYHPAFKTNDTFNRQALSSELGGGNEKILRSLVIDGIWINLEQQQNGKSYQTKLVADSPVSYNFHKT
jgi:hypothetical protein